MKAKLVVVGGDAKAAEVKLKLPTTIGRGREVTLTLPHPLVSRHHCEIFESDGKLYVRDLGSLNGTFVNNERIEGEVELPPGELLTVGTVTFRAVYEGDATASAPPSAAPKAAAPALGNETLRDPGGATLHVDPEKLKSEVAKGMGGESVESEEAQLEDSDFADFDDLDDLDELGEDEDWEELEANEEGTEPSEDLDPPIADSPTDEPPLASHAAAPPNPPAEPPKPPAPAGKPEAAASAPAKDEEEDDDDALNAFLKGLS